MRLEPALIIDITGSQNDPVSPSIHMIKKVLTKSIAWQVVQGLAGTDSQAADEGEDAGGVWTTLFADGRATNLGDLNESNFEQKWSTIHWSGGTYITPAFRKAKAHFDSEFGDVLNDPEVDESNKPTLALAVITDGALSDLDEASAWLASVHGNVYIAVAIIGSGHDHDAAVAAWQGIAVTNKHVLVIECTNSTDASSIASQLLARLG